MKRRSFLQYVIGGVTALFSPKSKADIDETLAKDPNWLDIWIDKQKPGKLIKWRKWAKLEKCPEADTQEDADLIIAIYANRQFRAEGRRIKWSKIGAKENMWIRYDYDEFSFIDFSPDKIIAISNIEGRLIVDCEHSIWEVEENNGVFERKLISYL